MEDNLNQYVLCDHCGRLVYRSTAWRHQASAARAQALAEALNIPPQIPVQSPPLSPDQMSLTSTERALSDLHISELGDIGGLDGELLQIPQTGTPHLPHHLTSHLPNLSPDPIDSSLSEIDTPNDPMADDDPPTLPTDLEAQPLQTEEPDLDILNANAPPPLLPTPDEIYAHALFGFHDEEDSEEHFLGEGLDFGFFAPSDGAYDMDDFLSDPLTEIDSEIELNAARARMEFSKFICRFNVD